ncbi:glycosyltransferase family 4 protein, partial [Methylophaga sp. OBS4]|uniref:glycosyltransferase family 4 protein n=1 Tax=Methylophaga sp. OBS4 TaxID=2991935 RepID=UPI00225B1629
LAPQLLMMGIILLALVLIPGIGREVNGSARWLPLERVQATIRLPLKKIVVADWLAAVLKTEYGIKNSDVRVVPNAVDHQQFSAEPRQKNKTVRFGFMYSSRAFKGSGLAIECFLGLKQKYSGIALMAFGTEPEEELAKYDADIRYLRAPSQRLIPQIYASCDAWLFTSNSEGFGLPILEAMACRTPVIGTKTGAAPELLDDSTGFLVDIDDKDALVRGMEKIIEMPPSEWVLLSERAFRKSKEYQWDNSALLFETALKDFVEDVGKG